MISMPAIRCGVGRGDKEFVENEEVLGLPRRSQPNPSSDIDLVLPSFLVCLSATTGRPSTLKAFFESHILALTRPAVSAEHREKTNT